MDQADDQQERERRIEMILVRPYGICPAEACQPGAHVSSRHTRALMPSMVETPWPIEEF